MAWTDEHTAVTIKAIATVESNMRYDAINYNDPITVGVAQWFGTRAAAILRRMRSADSTNWARVASSLQRSMNTYGPTAAWWNSRYLSRAEGSSLSPLLLANKTIQNDQFGKDILGYVDRLESWNYDRDTMTQAVMFACTMYHQAPARTLDVTRVVSWPPTLDSIHAAAMANPVLGQYPTRLNTVKQIIQNMDSSGVDFGDFEPSDPDDDDYDGDIGGDHAQGNVSIDRVNVQGDNLYIRLSNDQVITAYPAVSGIWKPKAHTINAGSGTTPDPDDGDNPGEPGPGPEPTEGWADPLRNLRCTQAWGTTRWTSYHSGMDLGARSPGVPGDIMYAIADGVVVGTGGHNDVLAYNSGYKLAIDHGIVDGSRLISVYGHCDARNPFIAKVGDQVKAGDPVARMGGSGANHRNTDFAVHLHLVLVRGLDWPSNGRLVAGRSNTTDPEKFLKSKGVLKGMNACPR